MQVGEDFLAHAPLAAAVNGQVHWPDDQHVHDNHPFNVGGSVYGSSPFLPTTPHP